MQTVKRSWLLIFSNVWIVCNVLLFVAYFLFQNFNFSQEIIKFWGITPIVLVLAGLSIAYQIFIFPWFSKKNLWFSSILMFAFGGFLVSTIIETSGTVNDFYRIFFIIFVFFSSMAGPYLPIASVLLMWILYMFTLLTLIPETEQGMLRYTLISILTTVGAVLGWRFFHKYYIKKNSNETVALSKLLEQEQFKTNAMLESISDGVLVINVRGTVQVLNESAATMLGWTKQEALKLDYRSLLKPIEGGEQTAKNQDAAEVIKRALASHKTEQGIVLLQIKSGSQIFVDVVASPILETLESSNTDQSIPEKQLVGIIAVLRNVDEQKRQQQQRSDFISTASHEMRTPVASIQGFIELALNPKVAQVDDKARGYLVKAQDATKHLGELFQDLLTVSKSDDGRLANNPQVIEITALLSQMAEEGRMSAEKKGLKVVFDTSSGNVRTVNPLMYVSADPERLREVIINLFDNAIKYTPAGIITIGASLKEQSVVIRVSDTGMGIATEDIPHLFQKFYRTDNTATREIGGTGLGLFICKQIVELMSGKIWVESTIGAGSTFFVEIPRVHPDTIQSVTTEATT